ncbi:hypothetical protein DW049_11085 [Ruminococcus sp. AF41-9]|nr:hypothetical protein DW049_11085 [Ruminococcus sp. AF41-9]
MGKVKKIIAGVLVVAVAGTGITAGLMQLKKNSQKTVSVTSVSGLLQDYYTPNTTIDGTVSSSATQTVTGDKDLIIDQVYVAKGDAVKKDDPLISFDTTLVEMELNIAKLKKQKQEQDLNKAVNRLNSLLNGGPVEETDGSTDADNLGTHGTDSDSADDLAQDNTMSSAADMSGTYLAAAIHPLLVTAFTDGGTTDTTADAASTGTDTDTADASSAETITGPADASNDIPSYTDPSASDFEDGSNKNSFNSGTNDSPVPSPTPTPVLDDHTNYFDPYYIKGDPNITDGNEPFYQKLDGESIPFTGSGTKEDPYVFLCSSAKEKVTVMGSFFNRLAGYSSDGTKIVHQGGYWYQLEFHQNDTIADYENRKESCTGYYLINGSLLEQPVYEFAEVEFTLADASKYDDDEIPDDDNPGGYDPAEPTGTPISRADAIKYQRSKIASLKLDIQESDIKISQLEKKANKKLISSKLDGTVTYVGDTSGETTDGNALIKVKSSDGFYVIGSISELMLDEITEGTVLNCTSYTSGSFEAEVMDVSEYPVTSNSYYGDSNPNVSYYAFTAVVTDKSLQLEDQDYVTITYEASSSEGSMVIQKAFVRSENGKSYVYKDENGVLKKQELTVGSTVDNGYSVIVKGGITSDDLIAFPYGKDVKEGAKTKEVSLNDMYGY